MSKIRPCIWLENKNAEEAMAFYKSVFPDFEERGIWQTPSDTPGNTAGDVVTVEFRIFDQEFILLNGGPYFKLTEAISFEIMCEDQAEVDEYWSKLSEGGGEPNRCGWIRDRFGLAWQIVPTILPRLMSADAATAKRVTEAMLQMGKLDIAKLEAAAEPVTV